ncbi:MAG: SLBB domain-containing protein [Clostridia bacterium]|nr:SLBB domain-containing protein [Clostridia bacterium]
MDFLKNNFRKILAGIILCAVAWVMVINGNVTKPLNKENADEEITLTIMGNVLKPGSQRVKKGSTIMENMHLFGGFTADADTSTIDLYSPLEKDTKVTIKKRTGQDNNNYDSLYEMP